MLASNSPESGLNLSASFFLLCATFEMHMVQSGQPFQFTALFPGRPLPGPGGSRGSRAGVEAALINVLPVAPLTPPQNFKQPAKRASTFFLLQACPQPRREQKTVKRAGCELHDSGLLMRQAWQPAGGQFARLQKKCAQHSAST